MTLGFMRRFEPYVLDGSKTLTIRAMRKRPFRVGDRCDCYVDSRQKTMRLLGRWPCVKVEEIIITRFELVMIDDQPLGRDECEALAWRDGFRTGVDGSYFAEMMQFWKGRLPFRGQVIHWLRAAGRAAA